MKLIIADDHLLLGQAVEAALAKTSDYEVTLVETLQGLLAELSSTAFDVIMLDLKMPGMAGLASVKAVLDAAGGAYVVLFTGSLDSRFLSDCVSLGVRGYIPKDMPLRSLDSALHLIQSGQTFIPVKPDTEPKAAMAGKGQEDLTQRELHILRLAADGMTNKEIARDISVTEVTVKMHMRNICRKLGARNRAHAAIISRELMLI
ncbi:response regulator transcription factor [Roseibacterium sp. SDUM158016]|uniref:LuxR C-terminal-related transcriptional regulator n=1 Tax=Roseicyclus sediminis TaxID=2980997 RepID=UPI0021CFAE48|nr:response regulator transcription factor [Roseibacterium sp. SDUM158016]MCU4651207.1 response regulator transcription factor [Roseibacterium sp. SDUM158016]